PSPTLFRSRAAERAVQQEVERVEVRQLETLDVALHHRPEVRLHALRGELLAQQRVMLGFVCDDAHIGGVTLVAGAGVRQVDQLDAAHTSFTSTTRWGSTASLRRSAGQYAMICWTRGRPPANPVTDGGPVRTRGAISRVKRSTAAWSDERTPMRSCTSGRSAGGGPTSAPCVESQPTSSVRISSNARPSRSRRSLRMRSAARAFAAASGQA